MLLRGVRGRPEDMPWDRVFQDRDAGDHALPGEAVQLEALLQGEHFCERPHAVAAAWPAHRNKTKDLSLFAAEIHSNLRRSINSSVAEHGMKGSAIYAYIYNGQSQWFVYKSHGFLASHIYFKIRI